MSKLRSLTAIRNRLENPASGHDSESTQLFPDWMQEVSSSVLGPVLRREYPYHVGKRIGLSLPRRFVCDLLHFSKQIPSVPMQRRMKLGKVVEAREKASHRVGWCAIFIKACALLSASRPELRRAYMAFPWAQLYEHPATIAMVGIERDYEDEKAVFFGRIPAPDHLSLIEIEALLQHYRKEPLENLAGFQMAMKLSRYPRFLRRPVWWLTMNVRGITRASLYGTFGISVVASLGAAGLHLLSPTTTTLNYGVFEGDGSLDVRMTYDHRVLDGATVARAMAELEAVLNGPILKELQADT